MCCLSSFLVQTARADWMTSIFLRDVGVLVKMGGKQLLTSSPVKDHMIYIHQRTLWMG